MRHATFLLVSSVFLVGCAAPIMAYDRSQGTAVTARYLSPDKAYAIEFTAAEMRFGAAEPLAHGSPPTFDWSARVSQCSDSRYRCLRAERFVFAVPRDPLSTGRTYAYSGVRFRIESCSDQDCSLALIRADCEEFASGICSLSGSTPAATPGLITFFTYSSAGVRSIRIRDEYGNLER